MTKALCFAALLGVFFVAGCASNEGPAETKESEQAAKAAASSWTPEQVEAFKKANNEARSGKD